MLLLILKAQFSNLTEFLGEYFDKNCHSGHNCSVPYNDPVLRTLQEEYGQPKHRQWYNAGEDNDGDNGNASDDDQCNEEYFDC